VSRRAQDRGAAAEGRALIELVRPRLPLDVVVHGPVDAWPLVGPALIARATGTLEAILALLPLDREADAGALLRSLYEHVATFAWLAVDPGEERMSRWLKSDCKSRLQADDDCRKVGVELLAHEKRREFENTVAILPKEMPGLLGRAVAADEHWEGRIRGLRRSSPTSLRGLYAIAYRRLSAYAHPSNLGLNAVTLDVGGGRKRVQLEECRENMGGPFGPARIVYALGLYVAAASIGWPTKAEIDRALGD
jgi:hypothetical protein